VLFNLQVPVYQDAPSYGELREFLASLESRFAGATSPEGSCSTMSTAAAPRSSGETSHGA